MRVETVRRHLLEVHATLGSNLEVVIRLPDGSEIPIRSVRMRGGKQPVAIICAKGSPD